ncbi:MAG TPA: T9SS type A sorting domain-containing protein, partial [Cytophagaceae bacterium]
IFTEDIGDIGRYQQFVRTIVSDPVSITFSDIAAVHSYGANGITAGSNDALLWQSLNSTSRTRSYGAKPRSFWQTETSGYKDHWDIAVAIYTALKYGQVNAWMHHQLFTNGGLLDEGNDYRNFQYYGCKHFFKFVKQGSKSVSAKASEESVLSTAFQDDKRKTLTVVLINADTVNSKTAKLSFLQTNGLPSNFTMFVTTKETETTTNAVNLCKNIGTIASTATITLPARGIVTLVGENSMPEIISSNEEAIETNSALIVYPNPSNEGFYIENNRLDGRESIVTIFNLQGKEVKKVSFTNEGQDFYLNNGNLENGVYLVKCNNQFQRLLIKK